MLLDHRQYYVLLFLLLVGKVKNDCFNLINGEAVYTGTTSITETGRVCQRWDSQVPHPHGYCCTKVTSADQNYCRNPDKWDRTWCMTSDPAKEWEACAVPDCASTTTTTTTTSTSATTTTSTTATTITTAADSTSTETMTTLEPDASTTFCPCSERELLWYNFYQGNLTEEDKLQIINKEKKRLRKELLVDKTVTSTYRRLKTCAKDNRPSAVSIGLVGVAIIVVVFSFICFSDFISICLFIYSYRQNNCIKNTD